jgi:hypothetical protein
VRKKCEVCGCAIERDLEVHHVSPQEHARNGRNPDGTALHSTRNLAILCDTCHTKHHNQEIEIGSVQDTSEGPERMIQSLEQFQYTAPSRGRSKQTHTEEELANIRACIQKYQYLHPNLIAIQIKKDYEISITVAQLKRYMTSS